MLDVTAVIPIRANSKGLPGKNTRDLAGKPLFHHSVDCARAAGIEDIIVATDNQDLLDHPSDHYKLFPRSKYSARDDAPTHEVLIDLIESWNLHARLIVLLQATSPLRRPETIRSVLKVMEDPDARLGCTVSEIDNSLLKSGTICDGFLSPILNSRTLFTPRQSLPSIFKMNGSVYAFSGSWLIKNGSLETDMIKIVQSSPKEAIDIDTLDDFIQAEQFLAEPETCFE